MGNPCKHAQWKEPIMKDNKLYNFFYMKCPEHANVWRQKVAEGWGGEGGEWGMAANLGSDKMF